MQHDNIFEFFNLIGSSCVQLIQDQDRSWGRLSLAGHINDLSITVLSFVRQN